MTVSEAIALAALVGVASSVGAALMAWAFCNRPAPRWLRVWRDVALTIV